jgi:hypothetical protein
MQMVLAYPWAVVFADIRVKAFPLVRNDHVTGRSELLYWG